MGGRGRGSIDPAGVRESAPRPPPSPSLDDLPDALLSISLEGRVQYWNRAAESAFGIRREQALGADVIDLISSSDLAAGARERLRGAIESRTAAYEEVFRRSDGSIVHTELAVRVVSEPGFAAYALICARDVTEQKYLRQAAALEARFRGLLESGPDAMVLSNRDGRVLLVNAQTEKLFGYSRDELIGQAVEMLVPPRLRDGRRSGYVVDLGAREMGTGTDLFGLRKDGTEFPVEISTCPLETPEGAVVSSAIRDITERKRAEQKFHAVLESAADAMVLVDGSGKIVLVNAQAERLFQYSREELVGQAAEILVPPRFRSTQPGQPSGFFTDPRVRPMPESPEFFGLRKDGTEVPVEISLSPLETDEGVLISSAIRDITEQKRLKAEIEHRNLELLETSDLLNSILESSTEYSIIAEDLDGNILAWNEGARRIYGYSSDEMVGRQNQQNVQILYAPEELASGKVAAALEAARETGKFEGEFQRMRKGGESFPARLTITLRRDGTGKPIGYAQISKDISEQKALEEELRRKSQEIEIQYSRVREADRQKSEFLANMSHELRTPLNAIIGFSELMHDGKVGPLSAEHREYLGDILASSRHLLQLINDILDLAKVESGQMEFHPEAVDLERLVPEVRDILRTLAAQKRIAIGVTIDPALGRVVADSPKLKQILYNYLSNALKFTPAGGRVSVRVTAEGPRDFRIEVEDSGIGIKREDLPRLFVEFQQFDVKIAKMYPGTGLGLALTKRIVEAQNGRVGAESEPGKGSTFFAVLPRRARAEARGQQPVARIERRARSRRVLVIDHDPNDRRWLFRTLSEAGYAVETAASGREGLARCQTRVFDAILLDLLLPDTDGREVIRAVRTEGPNQKTPVIIVTVVSESGVGAGFHIDDVLQKPVRERDLLVALERVSVPPSVARPVFVVDDDKSALKVAERVLKELGYRPVCHAKPAEALDSISKEPPAALILDLLMPEMDGFEFLSRFRRTTSGRHTPVIVWTGKDLSDREREKLELLAQAVVAKAAGAEALLEELEAYIDAALPAEGRNVG
jgi:PAS domain S-box-containing protein